MVKFGALRPRVIEALRRQEARTGLTDKHVFMTHANKPFSDAFMRKRFRHILRLAGLEYRPPKQMRHTFATLHIAAKENISWVSKMLGHASVETTLKRYNRFVPNLTHDDGSLFEKLMDELGERGNNQVTMSCNYLLFQCLFIPVGTANISPCIFPDHFKLPLSGIRSIV